MVSSAEAINFIFQRAAAILNIVTSVPQAHSRSDCSSADQLIDGLFELCNTSKPAFQDWESHRRDRVAVLRGKKKTGRQQVRHQMTHALNQLLPSLQSEYTCTPASHPRSCEQSQPAAASAWRQVQHAKLGTITLPLLELLEADDRLRKRHYIVGPPQAVGYFTLADVVVMAVLEPYLHALAKEGAWTLLPNLWSWVGHIAQYLEGKGVEIGLPEPVMGKDVEGTSLAAMGFSLAGAYVSVQDDQLKHKPANPARRRKRREQVADTLLDPLSALRLPWRDPDQLTVNCHEDVYIRRQARLAKMWTDPSVSLLNPAAGDVKPGKALRKQQQLESMCKLIMRVARPGQRIVEFGGGGGHLSLCLAHLMPKCQVVVLDRNVFALARALKRAHGLALRNLTVCVADMVDFASMHYTFELGVGLHFCGLLTDLALDACLQANASFVLAPCCYGKICQTHNNASDDVDQTALVTYPRSAAFQSQVPHSEQFYTLASLADYDPGTDDKGYTMDSASAERSRAFMALVDSDRLQYVTDTRNDYQVTLTQLSPLTCSPKNDVIVGVRTGPS
eukprot:TRINITY_DN6695_c0_g1_i1.p1 TRINITY_DN6695_c0_g1~~TRINITY_DN6695_c0_g1_i1.p1  ORF type:complete len:562 (+),score=103.04 TRINITY_DN6695_c0_g1_i1:144-1829(+)